MQGKRILKNQTATGVCQNFRFYRNLTQKITRLTSPLRLAAILLMAVTTIGLGMNTLRTEQAASVLSRQSVSGQYQSHSPRGLHALVNSVKSLISVRTLEDNPVPVTSVPAASYQSGPVAPESIVAAFGASLATR
jgi:hypothetical protein